MTVKATSDSSNVGTDLQVCPKRSATLQGRLLLARLKPRTTSAVESLSLEGRGEGETYPPPPSDSLQGREDYGGWHYNGSHGKRRFFAWLRMTAALGDTPRPPSCGWVERGETHHSGVGVWDGPDYHDWSGCSKSTRVDFAETSGGL